jgi:aldehyde dehydrogenase (NAD+)
MSKHFSFIDGKWVHPATNKETFAVVNPSTEEALFHLPLCGNDDVDVAVASARRAFPGFASWSLQQRIELFERIIGSLLIVYLWVHTFFQ